MHGLWGRGMSRALFLMGWLLLYPPLVFIATMGVFIGVMGIVCLFVGFLMYPWTIVIAAVLGVVVMYLANLMEKNGY